MTRVFKVVIKLIRQYIIEIYPSLRLQSLELFKDSNLLRLNTKKVRKTIKWKSILKFDECIAMTINWYRDFYLKSKDMNALSLKQIKEYQKLLTKRELK